MGVDKVCYKKHLCEIDLLTIRAGCWTIRPVPGFLF